MPDFVTARDSIVAHIDTLWRSQSQAIAGYVPTLLLPRVLNRTPVDRTKHWARLSVQSIMSRQRAFGPDANNTNKRLYEESGLVFVQLFSPASDLTAGEIQDKLADMTRSFFRPPYGTTTDCVRFFRARINDLEDEDKMLRLNVVAEYDYNETA